MARSDSEQRRRILNAAVGVFAEKGVKGATTRLIGAAAGVNSGLIYYYFEDKHSLFLEAVRLVLDEFLDLLARRRGKFADGRDRIEFLVNSLLDYYRHHPDRMRLMTQVIASHKELMAEAISSFAKQNRLVPLDIILDGIRKGELRKLPPIQVWWSVIGICVFGIHAGEMVAHVDPAVLPFPIPGFEARRKAIIALLTEGIVVKK